MTPVFLLAAAFAAPMPATFPAATHGRGELKFVAGIPVLTVRGTPKEIGTQFGELAGRNAPGLNALHEEFLKDAHMTDAFPAIKLMGGRLKPNLPQAYRDELAAAAATGLDADLLLFAATVYDLSSGMGCSTIVVEKNRSATGTPLFGRNFDWLPTKGITNHTLVAVFKPEGKHAFASVTISPITGVISGMNDAGLCCTINEVLIRHSKDKSTLNWDGVPMLLAFRQVLEECGTVAEAETLIKSLKRTTACCLTVCDPNGGAVFEMTPKTVAVRSASGGVTLCTNHFQTDALGVGRECKRLDKLSPLQKLEDKIAVADIFTKLHAVNQGNKTLQSMVFDPAGRKLHLKLGDGETTATAKTAVALDVGALLK